MQGYMLDSCYAKAIKNYEMRQLLFFITSICPDAQNVIIPVGRCCIICAQARRIYPSSPRGFSS